VSRKRKLVTISFKNEEQLESARRKAKARGWGFSEAVQRLFERLPARKR